MKKTLIVMLSLFAVPAAFAGMAEERCLSALTEATRTLERVGPDSLTKAETAAVQAAEKRAYGVCTSPDVHAEIRNRAVVRWSGSLKPAAAKALLQKSLRDTEESDGQESAALLPLLDALAGLESNGSAGRTQSWQVAERALRIRMLVYGPDSVEVASSLVNMGTFWAMEETPDRNVTLAEQFYRDAIGIAEKSAPTSEVLQMALALLHDLIKAQPGRAAEAQQLQQRLEQIYVSHQQASATPGR
jgi:hypothetical protein